MELVAFFKNRTGCFLKIELVVVVFLIELAIASLKIVLVAFLKIELVAFLKIELVAFF